MASSNFNITMSAGAHVYVGGGGPRKQRVAKAKKEKKKQAKMDLKITEGKRAEVAHLRAAIEREEKELEKKRRNIEDL
ncbi:hypothetical protein UA08_05960 [Talaromyces atroroseus]|uniref:Uncharacterized protein n=1 Tax=Talaromyces atroroseus TaxID=1441469 RepID=A0A225ADA0_TALAT|nr:hypothetical protein UA08_05960 [Talaromyces atroroseus]OKL59151.1 hypothetical protein UA08_05960 [Talaromyces atroroseus]